VAWLTYFQEETDVGLMVAGILAGATSGSAALATLVAAVIEWRS
jgi:hypothetical protein